MEGRALLLARLRKEANDPIDEFLALALAFEQTHTFLAGVFALVGRGRRRDKARS